MFHINHLKVYATDHEANSFGIQWMKYENGCRLPELVRKVAHVALEVDDLQETMRGKKVLIEPNSPSVGVVVAFIEEAGAPVLNRRPFQFRPAFQSRLDGTLLRSGNLQTGGVVLS